MKVCLCRSLEEPGCSVCLSVKPACSNHWTNNGVVVVAVAVVVELVAQSACQGRIQCLHCLKLAFATLARYNLAHAARCHLHRSLQQDPSD